MRGVNLIIIMGNLGADPELRTTANGTSVCDLSVAVGESVKKGDEWIDHTEWFRVTVWGKTAESCAEYLTKGSGVHIQGRSRTEKWEDKEGVTKWTTKVIADRVTFLPKSDGAPSGKPSGGKGKKDKKKGKGKKNATPPDDDIPF